MNKCIYANLDKEEYLENENFDENISDSSAMSRTLEYFLATEWANDRIAVVFKGFDSNIIPSESDAYKYITECFAERSVLNSTPKYDYVANTSKGEYYFKAALPEGADCSYISPLPFVLCESNTNVFDNNKLSAKEANDIGRWLGDKIIVTNSKLLCAGFKLYESPYKRDNTGSKSLSGLNIVVTGTISGYTRYEIEQLITEHGGNFQKSVTKKTDLVVRAYNPGTQKLAKAVEYGIKVIGEEELFEMMGD